MQCIVRYIDEGGKKKGSRPKHQMVGFEAGNKLSRSNLKQISRMSENIEEMDKV